MLLFCAKVYKVNIYNKKCNIILYEYSGMNDKIRKNCYSGGKVSAITECGEKTFYYILTEMGTHV